MKRLLSSLATVALLAACQPAPAAPESGPAEVTAPAVTLGALSIENARTRPPLGGQTTGAAYLVIRNAGDAPDKLIAASSPQSSPVELHTHVHEDGVMRMRRVESIDVPARGVAVFEPRGLHLMLFNYAPSGPSTPVTLRFEKAGEVTVNFSVTPLSEEKAAGDGGHSGH
jgi:periplasmic copper chaperone A